MGFIIVLGGLTALAMCAIYLIIWAGTEINDILKGE